MFPACSAADSPGTRRSTFKLTRSMVRIMFQPESLTYRVRCVGSIAQWLADRNVL